MLDTDVVVLGAGASGLAAARQLVRAGIPSIVIEARDRIGGRVLEASQGTNCVELGAEFIHGPAPETRALLRETGQREVEPGGEDWVSDADGKLERRDDDFRASVALFRDVGMLEIDESVERFLARYTHGSAAQEARDARTFIEGFDAADPAKASARGIAFEWESGVDSQAARPVGGYRAIFAHLFDRCVEAGIRFEFSAVVQRIRWQQRGAVSVTVRNPSGTLQTFHARAAIITLPAAVLRHEGDADEITFEPALPFEKREALQKIETGDVVKAALWFRTRFWEDVRDGRYRDAGFFRDSDGTFQVYWTQMPLRRPVVIAWLGGPKATVLRRRPREAVIARALEEFGTLLGDSQRAHREFEGGVMHDWGGDPFARGAYSYLGVGGERARSQLAAVLDDTLFFAGEATSDDGQGGTVNGALATGERAAREVAAALAANRRR